MEALSPELSNSFFSNITMSMTTEVWGLPSFYILATNWAKSPSIISAWPPSQTSSDLSSQIGDHRIDWFSSELKTMCFTVAWTKDDDPKIEWCNIMLMSLLHTYTPTLDTVCNFSISLRIFKSILKEITSEDAVGLHLHLFQTHVAIIVKVW